MKQMLSLFVLSVAALLMSGRANAAAIPFSFSVDEHLRPAQAQVPGLDRRSADPVGAMSDSRGKKIEFTVDEIILRPHNRAELQRVLAHYHAAVERELHPRRQPTSAIGNNLYLLRLDPRAISLGSFSGDMQHLGVNGPHHFSSVLAERLMAGVARLRAAGVLAGINLKMFSTAGGRFEIESGILEDPNGAGGFIDWAQQPAWADFPNGLGIGIVRAWDYLRYKAIPVCWLPNPKNCLPWTQPLIAIVDGGFALDDKSGDSPANNPDWPPGHPFQINTIDPTSKSAGGRNPNLCSGGTSCDWHGTGVFSIAAAHPRNHFGAAGTSAEIARLLFVKTRTFSF